MIDMFEGRDGLKNYSFWVFIYLFDRTCESFWTGDEVQWISLQSFC